MSEADHFEKTLSDFNRSVEVTRDVRFQAAIRLATRQTASAYVVSILSLFVIAISIIPNIYRLEIYQNQILLGSSIVLSVFVIFTSIIDSSQNFFHNGELLHSCARKIATVYHELKNIDGSEPSKKNWEKLANLQEQYRSALDACPVNHSNTDFLKVQIRKPDIFQNDYKWKNRKLEIIWKYILWAWGTWGWIMPHLCAIGTISIVIYSAVISSACYIN